MNITAKKKNNIIKTNPAVYKNDNTLWSNWAYSGNVEVF